MSMPLGSKLGFVLQVAPQLSVYLLRWRI